MTTGTLALIVDDCRGLALHLQAQLQALGLQVEIPEGDAALLERCADAAFVFVELQLLERNGFGLVRRLSGRTSGAVILVSGTGRATDLQWGLRAGARAVLKRPLQQAQLQECLHELAAPREDAA